MIKAGITLTAGNVISAAASFLRNILIARLVSVEDFGIASLFALTMSAVEMASNLSIDRLIVQATDGNEPAFQSTGQAFQVLRGALSGLVLFFAAEYIAIFFNISDIAWAFQCLSIIPVVRGFSHLDISRYQREMKFTPTVIVEVVPQLTTLLLTWPFAKFFGDYSVMLWLIITQSIVSTTCSHLLSERPYRWKWNRSIMERMFQFGWPLLINGSLVFIILQGDKLIVGKAFSMEILGWYSAAFALTLAPSMLVGKISQSLLLPYLSNAKTDQLLFTERYVLTMQAFLVIGLTLSIFFSLFGTILLTSIYDNRYEDGSSVIAWLGLIQAVSIAKVGPMVTAIALAETKNPMLSNLVRGLSFLLAIAVVIFDGSVKAVAITGLIGELFAYFLSVMLLKFRLNLEIHRLMPAILCIAALSILIAISSEEIQYLNNDLLQLPYVLTAITASIFLCIRTMPELTSKIRLILNQF